MEEKIRIGIVGTGSLGRHHARVMTEKPDVEAIGFVEKSDEVAAEIESKLGLRRFATVGELAREVQCAVVATTTTAHGEVAVTLIEHGCDVMIEKPITATVEDARALLDLASNRERLIQVGHVERFNPAIVAVAPLLRAPRFIEADRLGVWVGRSLDVDVLLDLMIHDINLVLSLTGQPVTKIDAVGIPVLTDKLDMANVRLESENGCVSNLTASRVASERVRRIRIFDHDLYVSVDTRDQEVKAYRLTGEGSERQITPVELTFEKVEPLRAELDAFIDCVRTRRTPLVSGEDGLAALQIALKVGAACEESLRRTRRIWG